MRVLVTGASGTVGGAVARALIRHGHQVVGTVTSLGRPVPARVQPVVADLFDLAAVTAMIEDADGVVHAASSNDEHSGALDRAVVGAVLDRFAGTDKPLAYTSGLWVHGDTGDVPATEDSPFDPPMVVSWRPEVEDVLARAGERDVRTVVIRPALVYGGGRGYIPAVLGPHDGRAVRHIGDGDNHWPLVHGDDLGDLYALALAKAPAGSVYVGTVDDPVRVRDLAKAVAAHHGTAVESWDPADAANHWGGMVEAFLLDQVATAARARNELGWQPRHQSPLD